MKLVNYAALWCLVSVVSVEAVETEPTAAERLFALKVDPLLREKCLACHGNNPDELAGALDLRSRASLLRGGETHGRNALIPGNAAKSKLHEMVRRLDPDAAMPPKEAERLTQQQIWWIRDWINGGAPWPSKDRLRMIYDKYAEGVTVSTSGGLSEAWTNRKYQPENLWAYQPLWRDDARFKNNRRNPIDILIGDRLIDLRLEPAPAATRRTLIRRASFDLLGLPPTPQDIHEFESNSLDDDTAFRRLVDRLLASPHYGEQWGRHWLDVVRYADSSGFANDWERPNAWRYRDYVIRAFNTDKPYDQFVREQIAGDEIDPQDSERLIASGFLRMGPWEHTGMSVAKITRQLFLDDVTDSVGQVFLAHALQCCRCHDHKFDPLPTRDYYSIQAVFATTQFAEVKAPWLKAENLAGIDEDKRFHQLRDSATRELAGELNQRKRANERKWFEQEGLPYKTREEAIQAKAPSQHIPPRNVFSTPNDFGQDRIVRKWRLKFGFEFTRFEPVAYTVYSGKTRLTSRSTPQFQKPADPLKDGVLEQTSILKGGSIFSPTEPVSPGVLSAVPGGLELNIPNSLGGRRTALANWIVSPSNSLTARVMVNRIWHYHFGRGIAGNPNNFGATGKKPTHPQLLDWLAGEFVNSGWSIKHMHRVIMNSNAYRRSHRHPQRDTVRERDPHGDSYAVFRPRRLAAEELRDSMLAVSGELNREIGGIPIRPDMNLEAALQPRMIMGTFAPSYLPNAKPKQRNRRTVYALKLRGLRDPFLETFNQPGSEKSCEIRDSSTVTPQSLTLLNSEETADRALAFAARVLKETKSDRAAIELIFQSAFGRAPDDGELPATLAHWRKMEQLQSKITYQPRKFPTKVVRRANEENTGETFTFTERLAVYENYVPDLQPFQVEAKTRGLADVCLAVFNSNEFAYVY